MRALLRLPIWFYRLRLGWLLGERALMLTHIGRTSGRLRQTVLEVGGYDPATDTYTIGAGWKATVLMIGQPLGLYGTDHRSVKERVMAESVPSLASVPPTVWVAAGEDRFGEHRGLGVSTIAFKVVPRDSSGLLILENTFHAKGGPARHLHYDQDEWFYALEGEFLIEVGQERRRLQPGDSFLAPRRVPHVWAYVGDRRGRILISFNPAGDMEAFFREVTKANAMPPQDPQLWRAHGMELVGPRLAVG